MFDERFIIIEDKQADPFWVVWDVSVQSSILEKDGTEKKFLSRKDADLFMETLKK
jgi:hypothetical protein